MSNGNPTLLVYLKDDTKLSGYSIEYDESQHEDKYFWRIYSPKVKDNGKITMTCIAKTFEESDAIRIVELLNKLID